MKKSDIIKIILLVSKKNIHFLFVNTDTNLIKEFIDDSILFLNGEEKFFNMYNFSNDILSNNIDEFKKLAFYLKKLNNRLLINAKRIFDMNFEKLKKETGFNIKIKDYELKSGKQAIYYFLSYYLEILLFNTKNIDDINKELGFIYINENINFEFLSNFIENCCYEDVKELRPYCIEERKKENVLNIRLEKLNMLSKIYEAYGISGLIKLDNINDKVYEVFSNLFENTNFIDNRMHINQKRLDNARQTDIFDALLDYNSMEKDNKLNSNITKKDLAVLELLDGNNFFSKLDDYEVAYLLYSYFVLYKKADDIISNSDNYFFKDLNSIIDLIVRRKKDGLKSKQVEELIDKIVTGKIKIEIKEREEKEYIKKMN